ncbi:SMEK domain-containing protein [Phormidesmis sp. 146-12]
MRREISLKRITELMSRFEFQIGCEASLGKTDLNKASETILIPLLNEVYGWELRNINDVEGNNNYPGIDLFDETSRISIQVTATAGMKKITDTLEQFIKEKHYLRFDRLIVFILKDKRSSPYSALEVKKVNNIIQGKFSFDTKKDILDRVGIVKQVNGFEQIDKVLKVEKILEANFAGEGLISASSVSLEQEIDWQEVCRGSLKHWKDLTTNVLTRGNGVRFQLNDMFVPLGLVERSQKTKHRCDRGFPAQGSELYEEKITPISQDDFFEQVLRQRQSNNSQGKRIAIIGEPGAGKTTQLQKIGDWILEKTDGIPIWIPLTALGEKSLGEYLLNNWLKTVTQELEVSQHCRDKLNQLLKTGKVWLLLDGVDEMTVADALHQVATQISEGWLQNVRVVLTCRLNVWDAGKNALDRCFDVYRNLDFDYPGEVHQFIDKWFATESELQLKLKSALEQPGKERIRDMVKNPLRLTLLCYSWQLRQGELPETKAGLYEWFVDTFYEWNKGKVPVKLNLAKRSELNRALGELAKEAIDQKSSRFRLRERFVNQFLGDANDEDSLFYLALQLGWLNRIGVAEENPLEDVYAFFHPTFQEYFAALAIDDWDYFLPHNHENKPVKGKKYRIFEIQWKEVILLWIGQERIDNRYKDELTAKLASFDDSCGQFYSHRAYFLAGAAISEFKGFREEKRLIAEIAQIWAHYYSSYYDDKENIYILNRYYSDDAKEVIRQAPSSYAITALTSLIINPTSEITDFIKVELIEMLLKINPGNFEALSVLEILLGSSETGVKERAADLLKIKKMDDSIKEISSKASITIMKALKNEFGEEVCLPDVIIRSLDSLRDEYRLAAEEVQVYEDSDTLINELIKSLQKNASSTRATLDKIRKTKVGNQKVAIDLIRLIADHQQNTSWSFQTNVVSCLKQIVNDELYFSVSQELCRLLKQQVLFWPQANYKEKVCYEILYEFTLHCAQNMSYPKFYLAWHSSSITDAESHTG